MYMKFMHVCRMQSTLTQVMMRIYTFDSAGNWIRHQIFCDQGTPYAFLNGQYTPPVTDEPAPPTVQQALDPKRMIELAVESYQCWGSGNISRLLELTDDNARVFSNYPGVKLVPWAGQYSTKQGVVQYLQALQSETEVTGQPEHILPISGNRVLTVFNSTVRGRKSNKIARNLKSFDIGTVTSDYKTIDFREYNDQATVAAIIRGEFGEDAGQLPTA
jgi:hypothetical protein